MSGAPSISVLMACRNGGPFLDAAVRSIARQAFRDWEMVVVDDASDDGSLEVLERWVAREPRIRLLRNARRLGQTASLNRGLAEARGRWIARQDADDLSHPLRLQRQWEAVTACPGLVLLGTAGRMIDANDRLCGLLDVPASCGLVSRAACFVNPFLHTAVMFRAGVAQELGGYDESFEIAQDYDLWVRMLPHGLCGNLQARLVAYRHLGSSLSKTRRARAFEEAAGVARRHAELAFPGLLDAADAEALGALREGALRPDQLPGLHRALEKLRLEAEPGGREFRAALDLRAAGVLVAARFRRHAAGLVLRAGARAPAFTLSWFAERLGVRS